jgi:mRNA interferase RelE/StbE
MFKFVFTQRALRDLETIDTGTQRRIALKLREYAGEPLRNARKLIHPKIGMYRFRIGDYRVIFDVDDGTIVVLRIGHRSTIYK